MITATNPAGWLFAWPERSDFIEVYHKDASYADVPVDVVFAGDLSYSQGSLNKLANESVDYARPY
jgi:hypothetical protein